MGYGEFAQFKDPDGNVIGLWRDAPSGGKPELTS
jgi:predicted enzyme related to lactoylglutathione lyase